MVSSSHPYSCRPNYEHSSHVNRDKSVIRKIQHTCEDLITETEDLSTMTETIVGEKNDNYLRRTLNFYFSVRPA